MEKVYLTLGATKYLASYGISLTGEGLRKAEERGEIRPVRTEDGSRLYTQTLLNEFVANRHIKQQNALNTKRAKAA